MLLAFADGNPLHNPGPPLSGLQLWFKADAGVSTSGSNVIGWADQSGNGHDASTIAGTPVLLSSGSGINGLPAIRFNNTGGNVETCYLTTSFDPSAWAGMTVIYVNRTAASGTLPIYNGVLGWHVPGARWAFNCGSNADPTQALGWAGAGANVNLGSTAGITNSQLVIEAYRYDKSNWNMSGTFTHGPIPDTSFPTGAISTAWIGTNDYAATQSTSDIAEILVYDHALSDADLALVNTYLNARYGA